MTEAMTDDADHYYDCALWDTTYPVDLRDQLEEPVLFGEVDVMEIGRLKELPPIWAARVILTVDDNGDPDAMEVRHFDTEAEARAASNRLASPETSHDE